MVFIEITDFSQCILACTWPSSGVFLKIEDFYAYFLIFKKILLARNKKHKKALISQKYNKA